MSLPAERAMPADAPSPLVGEGHLRTNHTLARVRGPLSLPSPPREPLTRLRFAKPPSPTRGEGKSVPDLSASIIE